MNELKTTEVNFIDCFKNHNYYKFPFNKSIIHRGCHRLSQKIKNMASKNEFISYDDIAILCDPDIDLNSISSDIRSIKWTYEDIINHSKSSMVFRYEKDEDKSSTDTDMFKALWVLEPMKKNINMVPNLRKCLVTRNKKVEKCYFHAWGQHYTPTNKPDGSFIGQVLGIVEHIDGQVEEVKPKSIKFEEWGDDDGSEIG